MPDKALQERRMRGYFTDAAKEIIKGEGMAAVSARTIADRAGYSYATLYNYFEDMKDLVFVCVEDFCRECAETVRAGIPAGSQPSEEIVAVVRGILHYFMQYQGVFELFYMERVTGPGWNAGTIDLIYDFFPSLFRSALDRCRDLPGWDAVAAGALTEDLNHAVTGLLLFYLSRHRPADYSTFMALAEAQTARICGRYLTVSQVR